MNVRFMPARCLCGGERFSNVFSYDAPPKGEVCFQFSATDQYRRDVLRCEACGHFISVHNMDTSALYTGEYVNATYRDEEGMRRTYERNIRLDPSKSDNLGRVRYILNFAAGYFSPAVFANQPPSVLDIGSGLCVFLHVMKAAGWDCTALDPDPRVVRHARETVEVKAVQGDFMDLQDIGYYNLITINKVLEHVQEPAVMLAKSAGHLKKGGLVYIELPDGEAAVQEGPGREEFFIEHYHIFSAASLAILAARAGFFVKSLERLREPSTKFTLRAFLFPV